MKLLKLLKMIDFGSWSLLRGFGLAVVAALCLTASVSAQKRMTQRCQGSATSAKVEISKQGDITIAKCSGRTLTIDGATVPVGTFRYIAKINQTGTSAPSIPSAANVFINTFGSSITGTVYNDVGDYTFLFSGSGVPGGKRLARVTSTDSATECYVDPTAVSGFGVSIYCVDPATGLAKDLNGDTSRVLYLDIEVF